MCFGINSDAGCKNKKFIGTTSNGRDYEFETRTFENFRLQRLENVHFSLLVIQNRKPTCFAGMTATIHCTCLISTVSRDIPYS